MLLLVRTRRQERIRAALFLLAAAGAIAVALIAYGLGFLNNLERQTVDARFSIRGSTGAPRNVVLVQIDPETFIRLQQQWPFRRASHAKVLAEIMKGEPAAVAFDIQFTEPSRYGAADDDAFIDAVARTHGKTVLATTEVGPGGTTNIFGGDDVLRRIGAHPAISNFPTDRDGAIRRFAYELDGLETLPIVTAEVATGKTIPVRAMGGSTQWIDYPGPPGTVKAVSYWRVYEGRVPASAFRDKIVIVGATAPSLQDLHDTATGPLMPGPEIQADAVATVLAGFPLRSVPTWLNVLLIVGLALVAPVASLRAKPLLAILAALVLAGLFVVGVQIAFDHGWVVSFVYPLIAVALATVGTLGAHVTVVAFERERVRDLFSRFVPEQVVDQVLAQTDADLRLGGRELVGTVLFSDLRGFTTFSESRPAAEVITILNRYLGEMSEAILRHGGTLVSYMGDGIMAVFGAPIEQPDHADRALAAAREMLCDRLPPFNEWMAEQGLGGGFLMGVGLNSGPIAAGNVGHQRRLEYTAIGDVTNTASRIEGMTK